MLPTGAEYNADLRLARAIPLTERVHASFMFDAFNAFNTQYTTAVNQIEYTAISGVLRPLASVGTPIAANGFPWGDNARHLEIALKIVF